MTREPTYLDLDEILPGLDIDYEHCAKSEREVITPALEAAGYTVSGPWFTGDGDSSGPTAESWCTDERRDMAGR